LKVRTTIRGENEIARFFFVLDVCARGSASGTVSLSAFLLGTSLSGGTTTGAASRAFIVSICAGAGFAGGFVSYAQAMVRDGADELPGFFPLYKKIMIVMMNRTIRSNIAL
jgi:hypothetical protein